MGYYITVLYSTVLNTVGSYKTMVLTYLLTPWCRVLLEKLTGLQLVKKFPAFPGTRRFITALTSVILYKISSVEMLGYFVL